MLQKIREMRRNSKGKYMFFILYVFSFAVMAETTAERLVKLFHSVNDYPLCTAGSCIEDIKAKNNTVIATYILPLYSNQLSKDTIPNRADFALKIRPGVVRDLCGSIQKDFP